MREYLPEIIPIIVTIFLIIVLFGVKACSAKHYEKLWNDGHCYVCGGTWKYEQAVGHISSTAYIYVCEGCGKRIEICEAK